MSSIIGIDLGTTNSVLSIFEGGKAVVIANAEGSRVTPSVVGYTENDGILVGDLARRQCLVNPQGTIYSIKRFMGCKYDEVTEDMSPQEGSDLDAALAEWAAQFDQGLTLKQ